MKRRPVISVYTPSNTDRELLKRIFVQREHLLDRIVDRLARSMLTDDKHHVLLIGPRGSGKTHLVALVEYELRKRGELSDAMRVAWLGEDDTFTGLIDIALGIADQLATEYPDEFDADYRASVRGLDGDDAAESILKSIIDRLGKRTILLIMENLDGVFAGLGDRGQRKWRAFLQEHPRIATLATSQQLFGGIGSRDEAFFGFFDIQHLAPLCVDDAKELIRRISLEQRNRDLVVYLDSAEGRYRIRALHHLAGGNHRMYVLLAEFLTKQSLDDLVAAFEGLAEDLTPYFQERVRSLPQQQARLVQCLCNANGAMTVKEIAEETFIAEGSCSKQLGNLKQKGYVQSQRRGKESFYEMAEPLMRLCLEVKNQRGRPLRLVAKFLRAWFPESQLRKTPIPASGAWSRGDAYRAAALELDTGVDESLRTSLSDEIRKSISGQQFDKALELSGELSCVAPLLAGFFSAEALACSGDIEASVKALSRVIDTADAPVEQKATALFCRGLAHSERGDMEHALADFNAVIDMADAPVEKKASALLGRSAVHTRQGEVEQALADYAAIIDMANAPVETRAAALFNRAAGCKHLGDIGQALADYTTIIDMADAPVAPKANALFYRGVAHAQRGDREHALADFAAIIDMADAPVQPRATALFNRGVAYAQRGDREHALADFTAIIDMADAPAEPKANALVNRGVAYERRGDMEQALADYTAVIDMANAPVEPKAKAFYNRGVTYAKRGDRERALADYTSVIDMADAPVEQRADAFFNRSVAFARRGDTEHALADYTAIIAMADAPAEPKATALFNRGVAYERRGDREQALADFTAVIDMADAPAEPKASALYNRGTTCVKHGDVEHALADLTAVIDMADVPTEQKANAIFNRGVVHMLRGEVEQELADFTAVIDMANAPAEQKLKALVMRGVACRERGDVEQALADFTAAIDMGGAPVEQKATAFFNRGMIFTQRGDVEHALADFTAVIDMVNASAEQKLKALVMRGVAYRERGDVEQALADFTAAIDMGGAPTELKAMALVMRGATQSQLGQYGAAQGSFERFLAISNLSSSLRTTALFALPEAMVAGASRDQVIAAIELAFRTGDRAAEGYGGTPGDLLAMVLRRGHQEWEGYIAALVPLYVRHGAAAKLGQGVTHTIELLAGEGYSESQLDGWNRAWQKSGKGCEELEIPLRSLEAAVEAIKTRSDRPLFGLPLEIREIVRPLLAKALSE
ncbi:MAG: tetratricopeptide repeat protein [Planctomycetia bacterium]|nr:tetratricopeptide repeat protein [Planctomycetia bacterium]